LVRKRSMFADLLVSGSGDLFSLVFEKMPTYEEIVNGTPKLSYAFKLSSTFTPDKNQLVTQGGWNWNPLLLNIMDFWKLK
jgi:hypothetical protein